MGPAEVRVPIEVQKGDREKTWEQNLAAEVDDFAGGVAEPAEEVERMADGSDPVAVDDDGAVAVDAALGVHGDDHGVVEQDRRASASFHFPRGSGRF